MLKFAAIAVLVLGSAQAPAQMVYQPSVVLQGVVAEMCQESRDRVEKLPSFEPKKTFFNCGLEWRADGGKPAPRKYYPLTAVEQEHLSFLRAQADAAIEAQSAYETFLKRRRGLRDRKDCFDFVGFVLDEMRITEERGTCWKEK